MKMQTVFCVSILSSVLLATGLLITVNYSSTGLEQAYSLLPGVPSGDSPFSEFINITEGSDTHYPSDYYVQSTNPYIARVDYSNHSIITKSQAHQIAISFLKEILSPDVFDILYDGPSYHSGLLPRWTFEFLNSSQDPKTHVVAFVGVNSISGGIVLYSGPLPCSISLDHTNFSEIKIARDTFEIFNTSIPSNSRYEQFSGSNSQFYFIFNQVVGPILIHSSIGGIYFKISLNTSFGDKCFYSEDWIHYSGIPTDGIINPNVLKQHVSRNLILMPTQNSSHESEVCDYRLCWWLSNSNFSAYRDTIVDAYSGEIIQFIDYHYGSDTFTPMVTPIIIPISSIILASISYYTTKRRIREY